MASYDRICLPTDGSKGTEETIDHALTLARDHGATVHVLYVLDNRRYRAADRETKDDVRQALEEEGERAVDDARVSLEEAGVEVVGEIRDGVPHKTIVDYLEETDQDLVVMGTHGQTGRDRIATLGSVTERVVKAAPVPVLVVDIGSGE